ncbi:MAG TPA: carbamoyl-phosphate synthase (glutamine-hydrolyzing) large subunit [Chloroflexota bacterium]|nr:carbamoyl-phosphate synthase (glutamine-hydrolyzing) large subunit [Chloroflexota bacterium]
MQTGDPRPHSVLLLGSGALKIGEAGEFDYSGSQAVKALKEEGCRVILVNPNIATVQTGEQFADRVYFVPVNPHFVGKVIERERPEAIMLSFGGQTALNCGLALAENGTLARYGVRVLGTPITTIRDTEDRDRFVARLDEIGVPTPRSRGAHSVAEALAVAVEIGYPVILRAGFALGGEGSGVAYDAAELRALAALAFAKLPQELETAVDGSDGHAAQGEHLIRRQVLIEEYLAGWKELEYEVVRDRADNCIVVCNMENVDPMGVHTGESIVVAPSQTLTNEEYHLLRTMAIRTIRHLGVVGECNIQFALDPRSTQFRAIEVNARLSRSSALASKATGYPLAWIAAKLALGHTLPELPNNVTRTTSACFEPALDYVVVKFPRWDLDKFKRVDPTLGSAMKSVGEVMAIGRCFEEALQKSVRMLGFGLEGVGRDGEESTRSEIDLRPTPQRLFQLAQALWNGTSPAEITAITYIDRWFVDRVGAALEMERALRNAGVASLTEPLLREAKALGFSDRRIGLLTGRTEDAVRRCREEAGVVPTVKQIDTLAAEYPALTNYLYITYPRGAAEGVGLPGVEESGGYEPGADSAGRKTALILGGGPYRIGSSVEFDWCTVSAARALRAAGWRTVMINCNPETVSTDYDECDALYFEELSYERVLDVCQAERPQAVVLSVGGQTANNLALRLHRAGVPVLGTSPLDIDRAEDRNKFSALLDELGVDQPPWAELSTPEEAERFAEEVGYPVLVRPSYVLSGSAMNVAYDGAQLHRFLHEATGGNGAGLAAQTTGPRVSSEHPVVISKFVEHAKEIEIDAVAANGKLVIYALSEHVENAGVHSGDATVMVPPQRLYLETVRQIKAVTKRIAAALRISGPFNIQFLARENRVQVIECNLRASRSFPLVSKVTGHNFITLAIRTMLGEDVLATRGGVPFQTVDLDYVAVKAPQFSFARLKGADPVVRVEMASTGEVATFGRDLHEAYLKSVLAVGMKLPRRRAQGGAHGDAPYAGARVFLSLGGEKNKWDFLASARTLHTLGAQIVATRLTSAFLTANNVPNTRIYKIHEVSAAGRAGVEVATKPTILDWIARGEIDLLVNITDEYATKQFDDDYTIRRAAVDFNVPLLTNLQAARLFVQALAHYGVEDLPVLPWDDYVQWGR